MYVHDHHENLYNKNWELWFFWKLFKPVFDAWMSDDGSIVLSVNRTPEFIHCEWLSDNGGFFSTGLSLTEINGSKLCRRAIISRSLALVKSIKKNTWSTIRLMIMLVLFTSFILVSKRWITRWIEMITKRKSPWNITTNIFDIHICVICCSVVKLP